MFEFKCHICGKIHSGSPSFAYDKPTFFFDVPEEERDSRVSLTKDVCTILPSSTDQDGNSIYCIRAILNIPIIGEKDSFCWGVWVTQSKENFDRYVETFSHDQSEDGSFGWLPVTMAYYKKDDNKKGLEQLGCDVIWQKAGKRPEIFLHKSSHPLAIDQREGIERDRAIEIAKNIIHK